MIKVGSLFDGIGGTLLSATMCGAEPVWASEIEKFPIQVTKHRFPNVIHLGDITKIDGRNIPPVDIIVGGSPCQDLSVAGKRAGLAGERSGLFMEQIRIIKEMRDETNGLFPRYAVWENVPGAFSSNNGEDFRAVIEEMSRIADPTVSIPRSVEGWANSGSVLGDGFSLSWRTFDAQYWGVPQRRRRIYLVADFRGQSAPQILFEREGLSGHITPGGHKGQGTAGDAESVAGTAVICSAAQQGGEEPLVFEPRSPDGNPRVSGGGVVPTLNTAQGGQRQPCIVLNDQGGSFMDVSHLSATLRSEMHGHQPIVVAPTITAYNMDSRSPQSEEQQRAIYAILQAKSSQTVYGISSFNSNCMMSDNPESGIYVADTSRTLDQNGANPACNQGGNVPFVMATGQVNAEITEGFSPTLNCAHEQPIVATNTVRRLTPLECERLQGYPDGWTDIPGASDSARYKALGNSFAIPNAFFVISGCVEVLRE